MEECDYVAVASAINMEDITSDDVNRDILSRLKENDPEFYEMWVTYARDDECDYCPEGSLDIGWLGYFIGKNSTLKELHLGPNPFQGLKNSAIESFCRGVNRNRSIETIQFSNTEEIFRLLCPFLENNRNLSKLELTACQFDAECARQFSMTLRACNKSLKCIGMEDIGLGDGQLVEIFEAMSVHPQLEQLRLENMNIERNECATLANILCSTNLQGLNLRNNDIGDEGTRIIANALTTNSNLADLFLSHNNITARGCHSLAIILGSTTSNLKILDLRKNSVGNEGALVLANALTTNRKLTYLGLHYNEISAEGWSSFSKVLCDTSSINKTFLSNHTLWDLGRGVLMPAHVDIQALLALNRSSEDKRQVAIKKILKHHHHFDMQPFFEWDLKVLPITINWFEKARSIESNDEAAVNKRKLEAIYQFSRGMPEVFEPAPVGGVTRQKTQLIEMF